MLNKGKLVFTGVDVDDGETDSDFEVSI